MRSSVRGHPRTTWPSSPYSACRRAAPLTLRAVSSGGPAFAYGGHDLGQLSVESVKLLGFGPAGDEGVSIAGYAPAPYPLNGARGGDVRQRVTGHEDQVRAQPGGDTSP